VRLSNIEITPSPRAAGWSRLGGMLHYRTAGRVAEALWFEVPDHLAPQLSQSGNPWLASLLPLAVTLQEPLELSLPVDPELRENVVGLMQVWDGWYPGQCRPVAIEADLLPHALRPSGARRASFFSGGLDSFHTLLRHVPGGDAINRLPIDDLLLIHGFDIPLGNTVAFDRLRGRVEQVAAHTGTTAVPVMCNLRESGWSVSNWGRLSQAAALAGVALALEPRFSSVLIPSSIHYKYNERWGTNPLVDPLYSTSTTRIANDGAAFRRTDKTRSMARSDLAMQHLRVCWADRSDQNCGKCEKCLRTLTEFELCGALDRCITFPQGAWSLDAMANLRPRHDLDEENLVQLKRHVTEHGRADIAAAIGQSLRRYRTRRRLGRAARAIGIRRKRSA
jgi:hypothetical protein